MNPRVKMSLYCLKKSRKGTVVGKKWERQRENWKKKKRKRGGR